jgi:hypothetical protein
MFCRNSAEPERIKQIKFVGGSLSSGKSENPEGNAPYILHGDEKALSATLPQKLNLGWLARQPKRAAQCLEHRKSIVLTQNPVPLKYRWCNHDWRLS